LERRDKAKHARDLRLTHFIDDRLDVLQHLRGIVPELYLFGYQRTGTIVPRWVMHLASWPDVRQHLLEEFATRTGAAGQALRAGIAI
jgi:hypothetical protein